MCLSSSSIFYSPPYHCITATYIFTYVYLYIYIYTDITIFYLLIYFYIYLYIVIYLTLSLPLLLLIKRVSFKIQVSQPAVTDDSYLRTDVKPPKLGKGALQYICFFYTCTFANARRHCHLLSFVRCHRCTSLSHTHSCLIPAVRTKHNLDLVNISPTNFGSTNLFELSLNPLIRDRSLFLSFRSLYLSLYSNRTIVLLTSFSIPVD